MIAANNKHSARTLSIDHAKAVDRHNGAARPSTAGKVPAAEGAVAPKSETENQAMFAAEQEAEDRAQSGVPAPTEAKPPIDRRVGNRRWSQRR